MNELIGKLFWSSRPVSWINTAFPFTASYILITGKFDITLLIGTFYFLIPYNLLMYGINDVFDYQSDLNNSRKGGVEGSVLDKKWHRAVIISAILLNVPFLIWLAMQGSLSSNLVLGFVVFMVVAYSAKHLRFKEIPVLDSITSSIHFVGPMVYGLVLVGWQSSYLPFVLAFFAWGAASHSFGAIQDIIPDRKAGIKSIATQFGARRVVWLSSGLYFLSGIFLLAQPLPAKIIGLIAWLYLSITIPYIKITDKDSEKANLGWKHFMILNLLAGFVITISIILLIK